MAARSLYFTLSMIACCAASYADTVIQVTTPMASNALPGGVIPNQTFMFASWEQTIVYSDVNISFSGHGDLGSPHRFQCSRV